MYIKGFNKDLKCRGFQFEVGNVYDTGYTDGLELYTDKVFHFCDSLEKLNEYYSCIDEENRYCEIEVLGELIYDGNKFGSNKIKILREITGEELDLLKGYKNGNTGLFNSGRNNSGHNNSGDYNSGDYNSGDYNSGDYNSGYYNSGDWNSGDYNSGDYNSGDWNIGNNNKGCRNSGYGNNGDNNSGDCNSGDNNRGCRNSGYGNNGDNNSGDNNRGYNNIGDWNSGYGNNGVFCTEEPTIKIFDKDTNMTLNEFRKSKYGKALRSVKLKLTEWILYTEEEMKEDNDKKATKGYLKEYTYKDACANWWGELTEENKEIIMSIPNFDADKFYEITGINID